MSEPRLVLTGSPLLRRVRDEARLMGHGVARLLSPQSLLNGLKTLLWLGPLTLLVWLYAEQGQRKDYPGEGIPITVRSADPRNYVELRMKNDESVVTADLSGPAGQVEELRRKLQINGDAQPVELTIAPSLEPGLRTLPVAPLLRATSTFAGSSVQIGKCNPDYITVVIDQMEEKDLEVRKPEALKNIDSALFDPPMVKVRAPSEVFKRFSKLEAQLGDAANVGKAGEQRPTVRVRLADASGNQSRGITYEPDTVKATFTVKENAEDTFTYNAIPIVTLGPSQLLNKFDVICDRETFANVTVIGPKEKIEALKADKQEKIAKPRAILEVRGEDQTLAGQPWQSRKLKFDQLPDPIIRISPEAEQREIQFRIIDRNASQ